MNRKTLNQFSGLKLVSIAAGLLMAAGANAAVIDLGAAQGFSGFFFGNVSAAADVEGRLAVGGDLTSGFDIGYRNAYGSSAPSLIVKGGVSLTNAGGVKTGMIYNGPNSNIDTNASIGPSAATWVPGEVKTGGIVYGSSLTAADWQYSSATKNANYIDFSAAKNQLTGLSTQLSGLAQNGSWAIENGGLKLTGDGTDKPQVFNIGNSSLAFGLSFANIKAGAAVVINSTLKNVDFNGDFGGDKANSPDAVAQHRDRIIFNLGQATDLNVRTFLNGSVLAVAANVIGSGHLEGTLIANSLRAGAPDANNPNGAKLELGYEPFKGITSAVPEPVSYALMLAGLGALGLVSRRRLKI
ncbi:choice-of-anchor A family protein [Paucibacter sp. B2R-40]|uniref:choice-of-anchor A family protein n=1 Tax=Paucibacter sp. B2R-40 TaxID=2893554 RepID=UPI0021E47E54|nr:collagen-binding domain-containing protein [Paucibacter sp. B2R-40]MCV2354429.1 choice-of-anchor A family protein [Paucibacter sp. B2R-40]